MHAQFKLFPVQIRCYLGAHLPRMLPNDHIADDVSEGAAHLVLPKPPLVHPPTYFRAYFLPYTELSTRSVPFYRQPLSH